MTKKNNFNSNNAGVILETSVVEFEYYFDVGQKITKPKSWLSLQH